MRRVKTSELVPGMVLASDVYNYQDQLIAPAGMVLTKLAITKLSFYSIYYVRVEDGPGHMVPEEKADSYATRVRASKEFKEFKESFEHNVDLLKILIADAVAEGAADNAIDVVVNNAVQMLEEIDDKINVFDMIHNMREYDDQIFAHSLNVALISNVLAKWLGMNEKEQKLAFTCGILHDIGKMKIPGYIIHKQGQLNDAERELIKTHPVEGYNILKAFNIDDHIKKATLMHHERYDGSGYPIGMKGDQIDKYACIVAIADVYEATTATRSYRRALSPFQVIESFEKEGLQKYDTRVIRTFLEKIGDIYMLNRVRLSNGMEGEVVFINKQMLSRPVVKCGNQFVDLAKQKDITILEMI